MLVRLGSLVGHYQAQLDGFKSRALKVHIGNKSCHHLDATDVLTSPQGRSFRRFDSNRTELPTPSVEAAFIAMGVTSNDQIKLVRKRGSSVRMLSLRGVAVLELNDPTRFNTFSNELAEDMRSAVWFVRELSEIHSVVLQGAGAHFSAGGNPYAKEVVTMPPILCRSLIKLYSGFVKLRSLPFPVTSAVHGTLVGGGIAACLNSDCLLSEHDATFEHGDALNRIQTHLLPRS